jgi:hypothetical protein
MEPKDARSNICTRHRELEIPKCQLYGLAALRVGYAVAAPDVARRISASRLTYGDSGIAAKAASVALDDVEYVRLIIKRNAEEFANQVNARRLREHGYVGHSSAPSPSFLLLFWHFLPMTSRRGRRMLDS